ncbi:MAG: hypothetical protein HY746_01805 [Elusimicrobia bacterium]|nr:hypothetical protein [Elusimicrobiota bacterium]
MQKTISLIFLAVFALWGIAVVREDASLRKISNKSIILGLKLSLAVLAAMLANTIAGYYGHSHDFLHFEYYKFFAYHVFWSIIGGMVLWYGEVWPAGDAKFFIIASVLVPIMDPFAKGFPNRLFLLILANTFVMASIYAVWNFFSSVWSDYRNGKLWEAYLKKIIEEAKTDLKITGKNRIAILALAVNIASVFLLFQMLKMMINIEVTYGMSRFFQDTWLVYFLLFFLWDKVRSWFESRWWTYSAVLLFAVYFILGYFYFPSRLMIIFKMAFINMLQFSLIMIFGRTILGFLIEKKSVVWSGAGDIRPGMILSSKTVKIFRDNPVFEGGFDDCFKDGITREQADAIEKWLKNHPDPGAKIEILEGGRPFGLWIYLGVLFTLLTSKNFLNLILPNR